MEFGKVKYCFQKCVILVLALQMLNLSVHSKPQLAMKPSVHTIGATNQIDCFLEFFYENICSIKGYDDPFDTGLANKAPNAYKYTLKINSISMPECRCQIAKNPTFLVTKQNHFPAWDNKYDYLFAQEIVPPPPKSYIV